MFAPVGEFAEGDEADGEGAVESLGDTEEGFDVGGIAGIGYAGDDSLVHTGMLGEVGLGPVADFHHTADLEGDTDLDLGFDEGAAVFRRTEFLAEVWPERVWHRIPVYAKKHVGYYSYVVGHTIHI